MKTKLAAALALAALTLAAIAIRSEQVTHAYKVSHLTGTRYWTVLDISGRPWKIILLGRTVKTIDDEENCAGNCEANDD